MKFVGVSTKQLQHMHECGEEFLTIFRPYIALPMRPETRVEELSVELFNSTHPYIMAMIAAKVGDMPMGNPAIVAWQLAEALLRINRLVTVLGRTIAEREAA